MSKEKNIEVLNNEIWALNKFVNEFDLSEEIRIRLLGAIAELEMYISSYILEDDYYWKSDKFQEEVIQAMCDEIRYYIKLGKEDANKLRAEFEDLTEMYQMLGYYGNINRVEDILLGVFD